MPHKYVPEEVIRKLEDQIAGRKSEIGRIRSIARHDKDGIVALIDRLKELLEQSRRAKDTALDGLMEDMASGQYTEKGSKITQLYPPETQRTMSLIFRGEEKMAEAILDMLTNSDRAVDIFVDEVVEMERRLIELRKYEQRAPVDETR